jgi:hypothetical protein
LPGWQCAASFIFLGVLHTTNNCIYLSDTSPFLLLLQEQEQEQKQKQKQKQDTTTRQKKNKASVINDKRIGQATSISSVI